VKEGIKSAEIYRRLQAQYGDDIHPRIKKSIDAVEAY
jgi:hypothetical protein